MEGRQIVGLKWAREMRKVPVFASTSKPTGAKGKGVSYEKKISAKLPFCWLRSKWFEFEDSRGYGICQPDFLLPLSHMVIIGECKLTWTARALTQLTGLYFPVVEKALGLNPCGLVICKNLTPKVEGKIFNSLPAAGGELEIGKIVTWHCPA